MQKYVVQQIVVEENGEEQFLQFAFMSHTNDAEQVKKLADWHWGEGHDFVIREVL